MSRSERAAVIILRLIAISALFAVPAIVMPASWMARIHSALGLGELPQAPIVDYLTRSLSAFYALHGAIALFVSFDLPRYRPVLQLLAVLFTIMGCVLLVTDLAAGMPLWWTLCEGPPTIGVGALLIWLLSGTAADRADAEPGASAPVN